MKILRSVYAALAAAILFASPASAEMRITSDTGGSINRYVARYQAVRDSGEHIVIDGLCFSACTLMIGIVPRERVCATSNALLGFHAAWLPGASGEKVLVASQTDRLINIYTSTVRRWIGRNGGLSSEMTYLYGRKLAAMVRPCRNADIAARVAAVQ